MGSLKRLFLLTLLLTFVAGLGAGTWVGSLLAAPPASAPSDRRIEDFRRAFPDLTVAQMRELRAVLARYDKEAQRIRQISATQLRELQELEQASVESIYAILRPEQQEEYDRLRGRR